MSQHQKMDKWLKWTPIFLFAAGIPLVAAGWQLSAGYLISIGLILIVLAAVIFGIDILNRRQI